MSSLTDTPLDHRLPTVPASRAVAVAAGVFGCLLVLQNVLDATVAPGLGAGPTALSELVRDHAWLVHLFAVTYVIGLPALLYFGAGYARLTVRANPAATPWAETGRLAVAVIAVNFGLVNATEIALVAAQRQIAATPGLAEVLWTLHGAIFTLNLAAIATALAGLGRAGNIAGLVPRWLAMLVPVGVVCLGLTAMPTVAQVHGSPVFGVSVIGFVIWVIFILVTAGTLARSKPVPSAS